MGIKTNDEIAHICKSNYKATMGIQEMDNANNIKIHPLNDTGNQNAKINYGVVILGKPIGTDEFVNVHIQQKITDIQNQITLINKIQHLQSKWLLLHYCIKPKLIYCQRTIHPNLMENINNIFENLMKDQVSSLINHNLDSMQWGRS